MDAILSSVFVAYGCFLALQLNCSAGETVGRASCLLNTSQLTLYKYNTVKYPLFKCGSGLLTTSILKILYFKDMLSGLCGPFQHDPREVKSKQEPTKGFYPCS